MPNRTLATGWLIARIFGISVRLHFTWLFIFFLLTYSLAYQILPLSNLADGASWFQGVVEEQSIRPYLRSPLTTMEVAQRFSENAWPVWHYWVLAGTGTLGLFVCVLAHELSHSVVAIASGMPVEGITLFVFGGVARIRDEARTPGVEFRVAAAGPAMSLAIGVFSAMLYYGFGVFLPSQATAILYYFMFVNLMLVAFNLLPGFPLDGGRLLRAALWKVLGDLRRATFIASWFGRGFAAVLVGIGIVDFLWRGFGLGALWWVVIGMFLWNAAAAGYRQVAFREALAGLTVTDVVQRDVVAVSADLSLDRLVDEYFYKYRFHSFPVLAEGRLVGTISLKDVQTVARADWPQSTVGEVMRPVDTASLVTLDEDLTSVFRRMVEQDKSHLPVVEDGHLQGIVTRHDMIRLLRLQADLGVRRSA